jgi:hypothetical protein
LGTSFDALRALRRTGLGSSLWAYATVGSRLRTSGLDGNASPARRALTVALAITGAAVLGGCGGGGGSGPGNADSGSVDDAGDVEASAPAGDSGGGDSGGIYPAFPVDAPQIEKNQGAVLTHPVIVTVTWPGDTIASTWEAFGDSIGASSYWAATTAQYGVGAATSGPSNHVRMTQPLPASVSFYDLENFVIAAVQAAQSDGGAPDGSLSDAGAPDGSSPDGSSPDGSSPDAGVSDGSSPGAGVPDGSSPAAGAPDPSWPLPTLDGSGHSQTIYSLFIAPSTTETDPGSGISFCSLGGYGYHDAVTVGTTSVVFTVVLECTQQQTTAQLEESASHEDVEAATNPYLGSTTMGYRGFDTDHAAWDIYTRYNDELADACENWADSYYQESAAFPYWAQRSWSNTSALAGHDPCVPAAVGPYRGMTLFPSQESTVLVDQSSLGGTASNTRAFKATLGQPLTFQVGYFSNGNAAPWTIAYDFPSALFNTVGRSVSNGRATVAIDKTTGQNGDEANVTVTVTARGASGFHVMAITWDPPAAGPYLPHYLPLLIVDE